MSVNLNVDLHPIFDFLFIEKLKRKIKIRLFELFSREELIIKWDIYATLEDEKKNEIMLSEERANNYKEET